LDWRAARVLAPHGEPRIRIASEIDFGVLMKAVTAMCLFAGMWLTPADHSAAQNVPKDEIVEKALGWLARTQHKDGHWEGPGGNFRTAMTALAGIALLAEGSTPFEGKFKDELKRAVSWLTARARRNGLLCSTHESEDKRYMYSHGFSLLFLANVYQSC